MERWKWRARRHWYRSDVDGSREPYRVVRPRGWRRLGRRPLVILLHGFGGDETSCLCARTAELADERGYYLLSTRGRGNVFYDGIGEGDFLEAFARACWRYPVDTDRVFLLGASMGGTGAWRLACRYPHLFAAVVPVCGWTDWRSWYPQWYAPADRPEIVEPWRMPLLERASTLALAENLIHVPVCALHGGLDAVVPPDHSRRMVEALLRFGADATYKEYGRGKHASFRSRWGEVFDWFEGRRLRTWRNGRYAGPASAPGVKRREVAPRRVVYVTNSPRHGRAYWVEVNRLSDPLSFGRIEVVAEAQGEVRARPTGLDAFTLSPPEEITGPRWSARVGRQDWSGPAGVRLRARREDGRWVFSEADPTPEAAPTKLGGLPGPIADAFASPFLIVAGGSAEDRAEADFLAARWARWMIRRGAPRVVSHRDVRPSHVEDLNLVLCGRPGSHTVLDRVADRLPARVEPGSITVGGRAWRGPALGLRLVCPNPLNTRRYVVVWFGRMPMRSKDLEGWPWLLPDYVVFDPSRACGRTVHPAWQRLDERVAQGEVDPAAVEEDDKPPLYLPDSFLDAGFFDNQWKDVRA